MRFTLCEAPTHENSQTKTLGTPFPSLCYKCVGSLMSHANWVTLKIEEMRPTVYNSLS